jgi:hypothetical protein
MHIAMTLAQGLDRINIFEADEGKVAIHIYAQGGGKLECDISNLKELRRFLSKQIRSIEKTSDK